MRNTMPAAIETIESIRPLAETRLILTSNNINDSHATPGAPARPMFSTGRPPMISPATPDVLIVDDESDIREMLTDYLTTHGLQIAAAADAAQAREVFESSPPRTAILDINMPGEDGLSLARWIREHHQGVGIIMLTTAAEAVDRVVGLEVGADDYIPKPFDLRELLARVRALLRRLSVPGSAADPAVTTGDAVRYRIGSFTLDVDERRLCDADGQDVALTAAEFDLLELFARHPNRPLNRDQIMEQAHNRGWEVFDRSIDLRIMRLRRKIEANPNKPELLKTVRGVGYVLAVKDAP